MVKKLSISDEQIVACYRTNHSCQVTARELGIGSTTVHRALRRANEPRPGLKEWRRNATKFLGQEQALKEAYENGSTYEELRQKFNVPDATIYAMKHAIRRAGGVFRENPAQLIKDGELDRIRQMSADGEGQMAISIALGRSHRFVSKAMRINGIKLQGNYGEAHNNWKGGRHLDTGGYVRAWIDRNDPLYCMALNTGHVLEHRLVMARKLGRALLRSETVHHIDGNRANNSLDNLQLRQGKHGKHMAMCCLDCGSRNVGPLKLDDE